MQTAPRNMLAKKVERVKLFREHIHTFRTNRQNSKYGQHILHIGHAHGPTDNTMEIVNVTKKGSFIFVIIIY